MNDLLKQRLERKLDTLPDERLYQVLDYIEFLESKYAAKSAPATSPFQRIAETVEDTLRAGKLSASTLRSAMDVVAAAGRVMDGFAAAGKAVVDQVAGPPRAPGQIVQDTTDSRTEPPAPGAPASPAPEEPPPPPAAG